jgi:hypothetical protein
MSEKNKVGSNANSTIMHPPEWLKLKSVSKDVEELEFFLWNCNLIRPICKKFGIIYKS